MPTKPAIVSKASTPRRIVEIEWSWIEIFTNARHSIRVTEALVSKTDAVSARNVPSPAFVPEITPADFVSTKSAISATRKMSKLGNKIGFT